MMKNTFQNVEEYISSFPKEIQNLLVQIRLTIRKTAPEAEEVISYQMPAYKLKGILVYFAAFKNHIGFFPTQSGVENFKEELTDYRCTKGTIQFPYNKPIPFDLVSKIVRFRVLENLDKAAIKAIQKKK
jgi:uncharacterized protein YdhG (YjbR/CyaY superfamily)